MASRITYSQIDRATYLRLEGHGALMIYRLKALVTAGYAATLQDDPHYESFELKHPNPAVPPVALWSDGQVIDLFPSQTTPDEKRIIIAPDDDTTFQALLKRTPPLTLMEPRPLCPTPIGRTWLGR